MNIEKDNFLLWLQTPISKNENIMDYILEMHEKLERELKLNKLQFNKNYYIVLIKLCYFVFKNSSK